MLVIPKHIENNVWEDLSQLLGGSGSKFQKWISFNKMNNFSIASLHNLSNNNREFIQQLN